MTDGGELISEGRVAQFVLGSLGSRDEHIPLLPPDLGAMNARRAMEWTGKQMVSEDRQDPEGTRRTTFGHASHGNEATLFTAAALIAASLPLIAFLVLQDVTLDSDNVFFTLIWLGIACAIAAIILGSMGRGAAAPGSELHALSTVAVVVGVIELVAILALTMFALALRDALSGWGEM